MTALPEPADLGSQLAYWDGVGATKTFTHPVDHDWLAGVRRDARVLDYGCGYGRVMAELAERGFTDVSGVDLSPALIERGRRSRPDLEFAVLESPPGLERAPASVDLVLLFAVLTCVPDDAGQRALVAELRRVLAPGGLLYVSEPVRQDDERNRSRYAAHAERFGTPYGVFTTDDGAVCRHHDLPSLRGLLSDFEPVRERTIDVTTMNGHRSQAVQLLVRLRPEAA
ncbi:class I SAM-dependent methyltransferase [Hamadaea tsunoensis]|uniref:class I SAM-dependent methyltransferase n=1 Tax=Hamadaea tsunoensis TaxID=53368 RepID=UPI0004836FF2|nr:class I SAM-dependent methyltransferase [Hamadaea tsunoensis]